MTLRTLALASQGCLVIRDFALKEVLRAANVEGVRSTVVYARFKLDETPSCVINRPDLLHLLVLICSAHAIDLTTPQALSTVETKACHVTVFHLKVVNVFMLLLQWMWL